MPRGGYRAGAGGKSTWKHGKTKTIRVPDALADKVLEIARVLDEQDLSKDEVVKTILSSEVKTESKVIDLTGVAIHAHQRGPAIYLLDLMRAGYEIKPENLSRSLKAKAEEALSHKRNLESFIEEFYE